MTFRCVLVGLTFAAALSLGLRSATADEPKTVKKSDKLWVFVGTYTGGKSKGIYRAEFDPATGKLGEPELAAEMAQPSFLAIHPTHKYLYAVAEVSEGKKKTGAIQAFALDAATGKLTALNHQSSGGAGPCHLIVDRAGKNVLAANYGGGSVCVLPIGKDGSLGEATAFIQHKGKSADPNRQEGPHAHSVNVDHENRFAIVADLGLDKLLVYKFDADKGTLTPNDPPFFATAPGAGPRHFAFHPSAPYAYVINELDLTLTALKYDAEKGAFKQLQSVPTLPKDASRKGASTAEVVVHPSGKFVYGSNRGHNSIVAFGIDPKNGELSYIAHQGEGIKTPRNFNIDPTGIWLLVANQDGNSVLVFHIDPKTGALKPTGTKIEVGNPVCVRFVPKAS